MDVADLTSRLRRRRLRRPALVVGALLVAGTTVALAATWPRAAWTVATAAAVVAALAALFVLIGSRPRHEATHASEPRAFREVLDHLPFGVLVFEEGSYSCTYHNLETGRRSVTSWMAAADDPAVPWDGDHLAAVASKLRRQGAFTEPLPRDTGAAIRPAEVRWDALDGRLLATLRYLSDEEEQRMVLDELDLDTVAEGGWTPRAVAVEELCWEVAEAVAGDRRPLGVEVAASGTVVLGDPDLLRAAISQVVSRSVSSGDDSRPVTLRLTGEPGSVVVQVDEHDDSPPDTAADEASEELGLARRLAAVHGGELQVQRLGSVRRTQLQLPRALEQPG
jgi:hypothetical protein